VSKERGRERDAYIPYAQKAMEIKDHDANAMQSNMKSPRM
jgi:predicted HD phosphohydrolase